MQKEEIITIQQPKAISLDQIKQEKVGGKASSLAQMMKLGLNVPAGFVISSAQIDSFPTNLQSMYEAIGSGKVAVRSSAIGEDGIEMSFAGQYDTILNVSGFEELKKAISQCVASLSTAQAKSYQASFENNDEHEEPMMCVVVQKMVDVRNAGVLFTADPVSGRRDRLIIDSVSGLGESLVSGEKTPDHFELKPNNEISQSELTEDNPNESTLSPSELYTLANEARFTEEKYGVPLDLEWAIDHSGALFWLQARPITTLPTDLNELDVQLPNPTDVITRCNIGEMMPGAVSPLTFSVTARAIENGMQHMHVSYAGRPEITNEYTQITMFYGHLFINLTGSGTAAETVYGCDVESLGQNVCGRLVPELTEPPTRNPLRRSWGTLQLFNYLFKGQKVVEKWDQHLKSFVVETETNSIDMMRELNVKLPTLSQSHAVHLQSSATSAFTGVLLQSFISKGRDSSPEEEAETAKLLAGAEGVESAVMVQQLDQVIDKIAKQPQSKTFFQEASPEDALAWLMSDNSGEALSSFNEFLMHHGHRSYRELCVREQCWEDNPTPLITTMQASIALRYTSAGAVTNNKAAKVDVDQLSPLIRWFLPKAHNGVRRREHTKSMLVRVTNDIKRGYRHLGKLLVHENSLPEIDLVFFFTHEELNEFVQRPNKEDVSRAYKRREALAFQQKLEFDEISVGKPEPLELRAQQTNETGKVIGRPVSQGLVEGIARVALTLEDASQLQQGEILIAPVTDVGWTPYFSLIAGLITDVGSSVSHGAVIAREYGLPAIVNTRTGTRAFKSGDRIRLDANTGSVTLID